MYTTITAAVVSSQQSRSLSDPWDLDGNQYYADAVYKYNKDIADREWEQMSSAYTNAGYREGVTAGKESAVQTGFDDGFATVGAPLGRQVGLLRGIANSTLHFLTKPDQLPLHSSNIGNIDRDALVERTRGIIKELDEILLMDIAPIDKDAEEHAKLHSGGDDDDEIFSTKEKGKAAQTTDVEIHDEGSLEAAFAGMKTAEVITPRAPRKVNLEQIRKNLEEVVEAIGLGQVFAYLRS